MHSAWIGEHHFNRRGCVPVPGLVLSNIAAMTSRIRLGPSVVVLPIHHPIHVAEEWAALDTSERIAWTIAYRRAHVAKVCDLVAAQRDELRAAELFAEVDGGQVHDDLMMDRVMKVAMLSMTGGG